MHSNEQCTCQPGRPITKLTTSLLWSRCWGALPGIIISSVFHKHLTSRPMAFRDCEPVQSCKHWSVSIVMLIFQRSSYKVPQKLLEVRSPLKCAIMDCYLPSLPPHDWSSIAKYKLISDNNWFAFLVRHQSFHRMQVQLTDFFPPFSLAGWYPEISQKTAVNWLTQVVEALQLSSLDLRAQAASQTQVYELSGAVKSLCWCSPNAGLRESTHHFSNSLTKLVISLSERRAEQLEVHHVAHLINLRQLNLHSLKIQGPTVLQPFTRMSW